MGFPDHGQVRVVPRYTARWPRPVFGDRDMISYWVDWVRRLLAMMERKQVLESSNLGRSALGRTSRSRSERVTVNAFARRNASG